MAILIWVVLAAALIVIEISASQLVSIWFAVGAAAAVVPALIGAPLWVQLLVFLVSSVLFLILIRPVVKKRLNPRIQPTNADMVIGTTGLVLEDIDNLRGSGRVSAMGLTWTARAEEEDVIPAGSEVTVNRIEGVKLIVTPVKEKVPQA